MPVKVEDIKFADKAKTLTHAQTFVAGIDVDGQLRGKFVPTSKAAAGKMPFCSVTFGWDCADEPYSSGGTVASQDSGFGDLLISLDGDRVYEMPGNAIPSNLVLGYFSNDGEDELLYCCPRSLLKGVLSQSKFQAKAGAEIEFYNFKETSATAAAKLTKNLEPLTHGMHGYSALRAAQEPNFWGSILEASAKFGIEFDTFHSETGPGVYECALKYQDVALVADQITLFKFATRTCHPEIVPCFMAKPQTGMPGNSGHLHCSLWDGSRSVFAATEPTSFYPETKFLSNEGHWFLGGLLEALPSIMLMFAPNINSYRRLDPNFWAPVTESWGVDNRLASIRLIDAYENSKSVRFEVRIPGADLIPHFALGAIFAAGYWGIANKVSPKSAPVKSKSDIVGSKLLPTDLAAAISQFEAENSLARKLFGDKFVEHYAGTRKHELNVYRKQVSEWEFRRYLETC